MLLQIITVTQILLAIANNGYRTQPLTCYFEANSPRICWMPLRGADDYSGGWLLIQVDGAALHIEEMMPSFTSDGDAG